MSKMTTEHKIYLEELRRSGETNMNAAGRYLQEEFALDRKEASAILGQWMKTYDRYDQDYDELEHTQ